MNSERYHQLLEQLLDGQLPAADADELVQGLEQQPELQQDLRRQLVLWEAWSQKVGQQRSGQAFVEAWKTRVTAEAEEESFVDAVRNRVRTLESRPSFRMPFWRRWLRPAPVMLSIFAVSFATLGSWWGYDQFSKFRTARENARILAQAGTDQMVTLAGVGACTLCVLREGPPPSPTIRIKLDGKLKTVYLKFDGYQPKFHRFFAGGTTVRAKGVLSEDHGRLILKTQSIEVNGVEYR